MSIRFVYLLLLVIFCHILGHHLVVGPVLGLITHNTVKILIETSITTIVTFHVFGIDKYSDEGEYLFTEVTEIPHSPPEILTESLHGSLSTSCHNHQESFPEFLLYDLLGWN